MNIVKFLWKENPILFYMFGAVNIFVLLMLLVFGESFISSIVGMIGIDIIGLLGAILLSAIRKN